MGDCLYFCISTKLMPSNTALTLKPILSNYFFELKFEVLYGKSLAQLQLGANLFETFHSQWDSDKQWKYHRKHQKEPFAGALQNRCS